MRILLIEDDVGIAKVVKRGLEQARYEVDLAMDGNKGLKLALDENYGAILLDLMLPGLDGWQICQELRSRRRRVPILMLTARDTIPDRVRGLDLGADDYLPKPFDFSELLARVRALLRRDKVHKARVIHIADLEIDTTTRRVTRGGREIGLSNREYTLLEALASREGQTLTREIVQETVWDDDASYSNTVDVYVGLLRKKIEGENQPRLIHTVRGLGYCMRSPDPEESE